MTVLQPGENFSTEPCTVRFMRRGVEWNGHRRTPDMEADRAIRGSVLLHQHRAIRLGLDPHRRGHVHLGHTQTARLADGLPSRSAKTVALLHHVHNALLQVPDIKFRLKASVAGINARYRQRLAR